ncbi:CPBP family intramembrane glutamic endopeptidase [Chitinimonas naiadis]
MFVLSVYSVSLCTKIVVMLLIGETAAAVGQPFPQYQGDALRSLSHLFVGAVLLAPWIETLLNQQLPLWLVGRVTRRPLWPVLFSALVFGLLHYQRLLEGVILGTLLGVLFATAYWYRARVAHGHAFLAVAGIHTLHNLLAWSAHWLQRSGLAPVS